MSLAAELTKLQERKDTLLHEVALIDRELESVAQALGVRHKPSAVPVLGARPPRRRSANGENWQRIEFWLRAQSTAKTYREIADGTVLSLPTVQAQLIQHKASLIHRGTRYGISEAQFADHSADLEEQRCGTETPNRSMSPTAASLTGTTDTSGALMTTASMAQDATAQATDSERESKPVLANR